jgi:hypothetical protein
MRGLKENERIKRKWEDIWFYEVSKVKFSGTMSNISRRTKDSAHRKNSRIREAMGDYKIMRRLKDNERISGFMRWVRSNLVEPWVI